MPVDIDATVIANRRLSADYNVLALAAPEIAAAARPGQFVMIKTSGGGWTALRCCGVRSRSSKSCATRPARPSGVSIFNKRIGVGTTLLSRVEAGTRLPLLGPLGRPFEPVDPPAEAWMVAGGVGLAPFVTLAAALAARRHATTLFYGARTRRRALLHRALRGARRHDRARDRGRQPRRPRTHHGAARSRAERPPARQSREAVRLRPDADDARLRASSRTRTAAPATSRSSR